MCFHFSDETFEVTKGLVLGFEGEAPRVRGLVTCKGDGETVAVDGGGLDRTNEVAVDPFDVLNGGSALCPYVCQPATAY